MGRVLGFRRGEREMVSLVSVPWVWEVWWQEVQVIVWCQKVWRVVSRRRKMLVIINHLILFQNKEGKEDKQGLVVWAYEEGSSALIRFKKNRNISSGSACPPSVHPCCFSKLCMMP